MACQALPGRIPTGYMLATEPAHAPFFAHYIGSHAHFPVKCPQIKANLSPAQGGHLLSMVIRNFALPVLMALGGSILGLMATTSNAGLFWPYSLMLMGMNSNRTEDVMTGQLPGFFLSCIIFLAIFLLTADAVLAKQDVNA